MDHLVTHARGQVYGERGRGQVSFARRLYERFRLFIHEMAKFGVVGGFAFIVTELFFNLFIHMGLDTFAANAGSTLVAAVVAFAGNRYWTFRHRERTGMGRETVVFFMLNGIGVLIQQVCVDIAMHELGRQDTVTVNAAFLVGVVLGTRRPAWGCSPPLCPVSGRPEGGCGASPRLQLGKGPSSRSRPPPRRPST